MARRRKKKDHVRKRRVVLGIVLALVGAFVLVALISHSFVDDARISGEVNADTSPFDQQYNSKAGMLGAYLAYSLYLLIGWLAFFVPFALFVGAFKCFSSEIAARVGPGGSLAFALATLSTMVYNIHLLSRPHLELETGAGGGYVGEMLTELCLGLLGDIGSYIFLSGLGLTMLVLYTSLTPLLAARLQLPDFEVILRLIRTVGRGIRGIFSRGGWMGQLLSRQQDGSIGSDQLPAADADSGEIKSREHEAASDGSEESPGSVTFVDRRTRERSKGEKPLKRIQIESYDYQYPSVDLLGKNESGEPSVSKEELAFNARMLQDTLETFNVRIDGTIETHPGPVITRYEFKPASGVKVNQIVNLSDDLALAMKAKRIRIIAPIPGKAAVGVEIPNREPQMVYLRDVIGSPLFANDNVILPLALGKTTAGNPFIADLTKMPHLLIAGATGSGKSVCMNVLITSMLYRLHPAQIRFVFIDPKMLELSVYAGLPHLARPVITNSRRAERVLGDMVAEMENRYRKLANVGVRNISDFNKKQTDVDKRLPYIVVAVDELADLMISASSSKTEMLITRLAQMSRAVGIHLILATQRPSVDVITGLIKANFPARIAFQVSSKVDSRTIIDANGAEKLLGAGDMLYLATAQPEPIRLHGPFLSNDETERIVESITAQELPALSLDNISQATGETTETEIDLGDPLFREACEVVVRHKQGSVSLLQRRLGIGYQRAARLIDKLEQAGVVSTYDGSKAREVLVDRAFLEKLVARRDPPMPEPVDSE